MLYQLLPGALRVRDPVLSAFVVGTFDDLLVFLGDGERVARLSATWEKICMAFGWGDGTSYPEPELRQALRAATGAGSWSRGREEGRSWSLQEALTYIAKTLPTRYAAALS